MTRSNLGAESQGWVRDMEKRIRDLEIESKENKEFRRNSLATLASQMNTIDRLRNTNVVHSSGVTMPVVEGSGTSVEQFALSFTTPAWASELVLKFISTGTFLLLSNGSTGNTAFTGAITIGIGASYAEAHANAMVESSLDTLSVLWNKQGIMTSGMQDQMMDFTNYTDFTLGVRAGDIVHVVGIASSAAINTKPLTLTTAVQATSTFK